MGLALEFVERQNSISATMGDWKNSWTEHAVNGRLGQQVLLISRTTLEFSYRGWK